MTALQSFTDSAGMRFQTDTSTDAINNLYAGRDLVRSNAAMQALGSRAQNTALNNYFMPYMGLLGGQTAVGAKLGSALAGVGTSFGNAADTISTGMGGAINSGAQNIGNLALANGQNQANMWGTIGGALGRAVGSSFPTGGY